MRQRLDTVIVTIMHGIFGEMHFFISLKVFELQEVLE